ncbi:MAG: hypothetical protein Q9218_002484 [Villophora microphyllina]
MAMRVTESSYSYHQPPPIHRPQSHSEHQSQYVSPAVWEGYDSFEIATAHQSSTTSCFDHLPFLSDVVSDKVRFLSEENLQVFVKCTKGFFRSHEQWNCYRRNYFLVECSFSLQRKGADAFFLRIDSEPLPAKVSRFCFSLSAVTDSGESIRLIQHRGKASTSTPEYCETIPIEEGQAPFVQARTPQSPESQAPTGTNREPSVAIFDRVQFCTATASNGKRRAAQQYFHLLVTLWAGIGQGPERLIQIATSRSDRIVVRGRSPGHYHDDRREDHGNVQDLNTVSGPGLDPSRLSILQASSTANTKAPPTSSNLDHSTHANMDTGVATSATSYQPAILQDVTDPSLVPKVSVSKSFRDHPILSTSEPQATASNAEAIPGEKRTDVIAADSSENSSVSSIAFSSRLSLSSQSSIAPTTDITHQLVNLLIEDKGLRLLCTDAFRFLDADRFERNLRRLLKIFIRTIREKLPPLLRKSSLAFGPRPVQNWARALRVELTMRSNGEDVRWSNLLVNKVDKSNLLTKYLDEISNDIGQAEEVPKEVWNSDGDKEAMEDSESDSGTSDELAEGEIVDESRQTLHVLRERIVSDDCWENLREGLIGFTVPALADMHQLRYHSKVVEQERKHDDAYKRSFSYTNPLLAILRNGQAACEVLMTKPLLPENAHFQPTVHLKTLGRLFHEIENCVRSRNLNSHWVENDVIPTLLLAQGILRAIEAEIGNIYVRYLQQRYELSGKPEDIEIFQGVGLPSYNQVEAFMLYVKQAAKLRPLLRKLQTRRRFKKLMALPTKEKDLIEPHAASVSTPVDVLIAQLPRKRLCELAALAEAGLPAPASSSEEDTKVEIQQPLAGAMMARLKTRFPYLLTRQLRPMIESWRKSRRPFLPLGHERVEWRCDCGELLWGDFQAGSMESAESFAQWLERPNHQHVTHHPITNVDGDVTAQSPVQLRDMIPNDSQNLGNSPGIEALQTPCSLQSFPAIKERYLELCVNTSEYDITLAEIEISTSETVINSDGELFDEIRRRYHKCRGALGFYNWLLLKPVGVHFVQFCLNDDNVGILQSPLSLPTEKDVLKSREWEFCPCPCPLKAPPPIPTNVFLHLINSKRTHPRGTWLRRLPKKLNRSIQQSCEVPHAGLEALGWGIHIVEGLNWQAVVLLYCVLALVGLAVAVTYSVLKADVQAGAENIGWPSGKSYGGDWEAQNHGCISRVLRRTIRIVVLK